MVVGLLDPDPTIYGYGIHRLEKNRVMVDYLPRSIRISIARQNSKFIAEKKKRFRLTDFDKMLPRYVTEHDLEGYLRTAHALFRMYQGDRVVWLFPRLPSLADKHRFHAWWAQGLFLNDHVRRVDVIIAREDLELAIEEASKPHAAYAHPPIISVLKETRGIRKVRVHVEPYRPEDHSRSLFLFYNHDRLEYMIDASRVREYGDGAQELIGYLVRRADDVQLKREYQEAVDKSTKEEGESFYDAIRRRLPKMASKSEEASSS